MAQQQSHIGADSIQSIIATAGYFDSLPDDNGCDTAFLSSVAARHVEIPAPVANSECRPVFPLNDTGTIALLLLVFLSIALNYKKGHKYFSHLGSYLFSVRRRQNNFDDHTVSETNMMSALIANTCAMGGIIIYLAVGYYRPELVVGQPVAKYVWALSAFVLLFFLAQQLLYRLLGYTFLPDKISRKLLIDGFNSSQSAMGLFLIPLAFVMLLFPATLEPMLCIAAMFYIFARIVFICKGFRIFFNNLASLLYFILYLCSVEIVPVILSFTGAIFLCGILQS